MSGSRGVWFVAGTAAGVYLTGRMRRAAEALTVDGVHDRLSGWFAGARVVREELHLAANHKETQLRSRLAAVASATESIDRADPIDATDPTDATDATDATDPELEARHRLELERPHAGGADRGTATTRGNDNGRDH